MDNRISFGNNDPSSKSHDDSAMLDLLFADLMADTPKDQDSSSEEDNNLEKNTGTLYLRKARLTRTTSKIFVQPNSALQQSEFTPVAKLGQGTYASVRRFTDNLYHNSIAVKKPRKSHLPCATREEQAKILKDAELELSYLRRAYPQEGPYSLYKFGEINPEPNTTFPYIADWRIIEPYIPGETFLKFSEHIHDPDLIAIIIFNTAVEIQRIHELGIIHGDISSKNVMILPDLSAHLIDFDFAYDMGGLATTVDIHPKTPCYFAPERLNTKNCPAHPAQDIYSFALMLNPVIDHFRDAMTKIEFHDKYGCITDFVAKGLSRDPNERQDLITFLTHLKNLLMISRLKVLLSEEASPEQIKLMEQFAASVSEKDALRLLYTLCQNEQYTSAQTLLDFLIGRAPGGEDNASFELINLIIELGTKFPKFTAGFYHESTRRDMIRNLRTAYKAMDIIINHPEATASVTLDAEMHATPVLKDIYQRLCQQAYLVRPLVQEACRMF